jgi:hypothetical protein
MRVDEIVCDGTSEIHPVVNVPQLLQHAALQAVAAAEIEGNLIRTSLGDIGNLILREVRRHRPTKLVAPFWTRSLPLYRDIEAGIIRQRRVAVSIGDRCPMVQPKVALLLWCVRKDLLTPTTTIGIDLKV